MLSELALITLLNFSIFTYLALCILFKYYLITIIIILKLNFDEIYFIFFNHLVVRRVIDL